MSNIYLFVWGLFATLLAVGPLAVAAYLDSKNDSAKAVGEVVKQKHASSRAL